MKKGKKVFIVAICAVLTVVGVYLQFFVKNETVEKNENNSTETAGKDSENMENIFDYSDKELPDESVLSNAEIADSDIYVYFSNTDLLDASSLPLEGQAKLVSAAQKYLILSGYEDVSELYIENDTFIDDAEQVQFDCYMDGHEDMLRVTYQEGKLKFSVIIK